MTNCRPISASTLKEIRTSTERVLTMDPSNSTQLHPYHFVMSGYRMPGSEFSSQDWVNIITGLTHEMKPRLKYQAGFVDIEAPRDAWRGIAGAPNLDRLSFKTPLRSRVRCRRMTRDIMVPYVTSTIHPEAALFLAHEGYWMEIGFTVDGMERQPYWRNVGPTHIRELLDSRDTIGASRIMEQVLHNLRQMANDTATRRRELLESDEAFVARLTEVASRIYF